MFIFRVRLDIESIENYIFLTNLTLYMYSWIALTEELLNTLVEEMQYCMLFEYCLLPHLLKDP